MTLPVDGERERAGARAGRSGFTLAELLMVVAVLAAAAGLVLLASAKVQGNAEDTATKATLRAAADAIRGTPQSQGYAGDVGKFPGRIADILRRPDDVPDFIPQNVVGWNGPYLRAPAARYTPRRVDPAESPPDPYGAEDGSDPAILDGWGSPIVLQVPDPESDGASPSLEEQKYSRLVSAGPDGIVQTPRTGAVALMPPRDLCGDDIVLFLQVTDLRQ